MRTTAAAALSFAVLASVAGCGGGGSKPSAHQHRHAVIKQTPAGSATSTSPAPLPTHTVTVTASASTSPTPTANVTKLTGFKQFQSPSKNVGCEMDGNSARCDIKQRTWTPPAKPADCPVDYGQGIQVLKKGKAEFVCAGDTALDPKADVLAYGDAFQIGNVQCTSLTSGMTCENLDSGHGFTISREGYHLS